MASSDVVLPLSKRPLDLLFLAFFVVNLTVITYIIDIEQLIIKDPRNFKYPLWPPPFCVDIIHWYGNTFDPVLMARPVWWKVTIWWDSLFFGPFYAFAIYAFVHGKEWIRIPSIIYSSVLLTIISVILSEEIWGPVPAANLPFVLAVNVPWVLFPLGLLYRCATNELLFTSPSAGNPPKKRQ